MNPTTPEAAALERENAHIASTCDHAYRIWQWDSYMMPSTPPRALVGWYAICHKCKLGYQYDAKNTTRKWWQLFRWYKARPKG